jgi:hypothetical protein
MLNVWVPLIDVDEKNGCLGFLKGSHNFEFTLRGSSITFIATYNKYEDDDILGAMYKQYPLELAPMKKGEAVIYDQRMAHFSYPNQSPSSRLAASLMCMPVEATPIHYYRQPNGDVAVLEAHTDFYLNYTFGSIPTDTLKQLDTIPADRIKSLQDQALVNVKLPFEEREALSVQDAIPAKKPNFLQRLFFGKK